MTSTASKIDALTRADATAELQLAKAGGDPRVAETQAVTDVRQCMNALRGVSAVLAKVESMELPDAEAQAQAFKRLLDDASEGAAALLVRMGHDPEDRRCRWMRNVVERWLLGGDGTALLAQDPVADRAVEALLSREDSDPRRQSELFREQPYLDLVLFRGLAQLRIAQESFDFYRTTSTASDLAEARNKCVQSALQMMEEWVPSMTPAGDRVTFLGVLLEQTFALMEQAWKHCAGKAMEARKSATDKQWNTWKKAHPNGFPIEPVWERFEHSVHRLSRLTNEIRGRR